MFLLQLAGRNFYYTQPESICLIGISLFPTPRLSRGFLFTKSSHSFARMTAFCLFYCKLYLFNPVFGLFRRPRITDISLRKSFQKRPIGNITVCNRKSPVFGIYIIVRLYAIFFCVFPAPFFRIFSEFLANPD